MTDAIQTTPPFTGYSAQSLAAGASRPGQKLVCSSEGGWRSILLQTFEQPGRVDDYQTVASPDYLIVLCLRGQYDIESWSAGAWKSGHYTPGVGGLTLPGTRNRLRWRSKTSATSTVLRLSIPAHFFSEAVEGLRDSGYKRPLDLPDRLVRRDATTFTVATTLLNQLKAGAPDLCAETGARFLATHLLLNHQKYLPVGENIPPESGKGSDRSLVKAFEYMQSNFNRSISLEALAREAGISRFHFARRYRAFYGLPPHQHLVQIRIQHARELLLDTDLAVLDVALECGYEHRGHFAAAFKAAVGVLPDVFRKAAR